jgi:putative ATP-binding cassette transporter
MTLLAFLIRFSWRSMAIAVLMGALSGGATAGLIALIGQGIAGEGSIGWNLLAWGFVGLALVSLITGIVSQVTLIHLVQKAIFQLRLDLSRRILASELTHLDKLGVPRLLATLTDDIQTIADAVRFVPFLCIDLAIVTGCLLYIIWLSWQVFAIVAFLMVVAMGSCQWLLRRGQKFLAAAREQQDLLFRDFRGLTEGRKELKLNYRRRLDFLQKDLSETADAYRRYNTRGLQLFTATSSWGKLIFFFSIGFILFALPKWMNLNRQTLTSYAITFTYLMLPMDNIFRSLPVLSRVKVALRKIQSLDLSLRDSAETVGPPAPNHTDWRSWSLKGVTYTYPVEGEEKPFVLGPIDLTLRPGELVFIVGGNGSGKSTLAKILTGLYPPEGGEIVFDGRTIDDSNREWYRQHFSAVFADFYLFERLLFPESDRSFEVDRYLETLKLKHKVAVADGRLSTIALSTGQRKRLALLNAYLEDRPIYVFDEWAADQDPTFKDLFYREFLPELKARGKTVFVISHDDRYFGPRDRQIELNYGWIERDRHENL